VRPRSRAAFEKLYELALLLERRLDAFAPAVGLLEPQGESVAGVVSRSVRPRDNLRFHARIAVRIL